MTVFKADMHKMDNKSVSYTIENGKVAIKLLVVVDTTVQHKLKIVWVTTNAH